MITPDHDCAWTRRRESELSRYDGVLIGWGLSRSVVESAGRRLSVSLASAGAGDDEDEDDEGLILGPWRGNIHDGCIVTFDSDAPELLHALLAGTLELHEFYLGGPVSSQHLERLVGQLDDGTTIRLRSLPQRGELRVKRHRYDAGWWERFTTRFEPL